ncbi:MAG: SHOCT domain-containing protein [Alphaproteobacteria bacterium]|nr:SHOCT domain-containing protein [Alphaproteobacteria bacterium]MBU1516193.1 SHOCT domain-containing protein [Alphaproteobacteria bacterium]MBU2093503.1 SHOCT domain-containing protein [Alphaproteobacteria bacterium]MBU2152351.1 SHOCT domain-containing protein [Alphaproteobacteria bacterium]MBU2308165.1 SHOCT domain-containing protein [Alphaproteobacteria bacterium]
MKGIVSLLQAIGIWLLVVLLSVGVGTIPLAIWAALVFLGAAGRADKANATLDRTLMTGETVIARALQHRVFSLFSRRTAIAITSSRILVVKRGLLGGFKMADMQWKDLKDVRLEQNILESICGSNLAFASLDPAHPGIAVDGVPDAAASGMYAKAQYEEQAWEEKRRVRGLEETRAASGGVMIGAGDGAGGGASGDRMVDEIRKAKELLDSGAVSDAEFQEMKAKILGRA